MECPVGWDRSRLQRSGWLAVPDPGRCPGLGWGGPSALGLVDGTGSRAGQRDRPMQEQIRRDDYALSSGRAISCLYVTVCVARHALRSRVSKSFSMVLRLSL